MPFGEGVGAGVLFLAGLASVALWAWLQVPPLIAFATCFVAPIAGWVLAILLRPHWFGHDTDAEADLWLAYSNLERSLHELDALKSGPALGWGEQTPAQMPYGEQLKLLARLQRQLGPG